MMKLSELCVGVKPFCPQLKSQAKFIDELFEAAGGKPFIADSYKKGLFNGSKPFTDNQKSPQSGKDNIAALTNFFANYIDESKIPLIIAAFGIPEKNTPDKNALAMALAKQMKALIESDAEETDNILILEYQNAKRSDNLSVEPLRKPLYEGDSVYVNFSPNKQYVIESHDTFEHTWILENTGAQRWTERRLVYVRGLKDRPEATPSIVEIPETKPKERIKITTTFDGRGFDGVTDCVWEMQDSEGENCFPDRNTLFCVTIDSKFKRKK